MGNVSKKVYAKFRCAALRIKKALGTYSELITTRKTTRVAFWDPLSRSKNDKENLASIKSAKQARPKNPRTEPGPESKLLKWAALGQN